MATGKKWIQAAHLKKGALRKSLGVKAGKTISTKKLNAAIKKGSKPKASAGAKLTAKRARLAKTFKKMRH